VEPTIVSVGSWPDSGRSSGFSATLASWHCLQRLENLPLALIVIGSLGVAEHLGLVPIGMFHLIGSLWLIALGVAPSVPTPARLRQRSAHPSFRMTGAEPRGQRITCSRT